MTPRQEKLKILIESSPVLTTLERQDWLDMLELMNDKQLGELETILQPKSAPSIAAAPPLTHIANLPTGISPVLSPNPAPAPTVPAFAKASAPQNKWLDDMKLVMTEKELPPGHTQTASPPIISKPAPKPVSPPLVRPPTPTPKPITSVPDSQPKPQLIEMEEDTGARVPADWQPSTAEDASLLSVAIYRNIGAENLTLMLRNLVKRQGYAKVLIALEKSNLHKAYVIAGQNLLVAGEEAKNTISKNEFEEIADIFAKIQVN